MKTVTIYGYKNFLKIMIKAAFELESRKKHIVLQCPFNESKMNITPIILGNLKHTYFRKIDRSDRVI